MVFTYHKQLALNKSVPFLKERNLKPYNFLNDHHEIPMVFSWMPALSIYFDDPDGHCLEFISILEGQPRPELGIITYDEWERLTTKQNG